MSLIYRIIALIITLATSSQFILAQSITLSENSCIFGKKDTKVNIYYPLVIAEGINPGAMDNINQWVFGTLVNTGQSGVVSTVTNAESLASFLKLSAQKVANEGIKSRGEAFAYQYYSTWSGFVSKRLVSIFLDRYLFTGGANGLSVGGYGNFDPQTGKPIDLRSYINDTTELLKYAAQLYCKDRRLPANAMKSQTGLFCELSDLPMPKNIGFSKKGMVLYYNMYEIGPRVLGAVKITIPYGKFRKLVSERVAFSGGGGKEFNSNVKSSENEVH